jgi:hypothetical protein
MCAATARQCASLPKVYVPIDGSTLSLVDRKNVRGLGAVGSWHHGGQGLQVITAMAVDGEGVPIGIAAQTWWVRTERSPARPSSRRRVTEKETRFAVGTVEAALCDLREKCPQTALVGVMDRGFD